jgi:hypothetical protein
MPSTISRAFLMSHAYATRPKSLILLDSITLISTIFTEEETKTTCNNALYSSNVIRVETHKPVDE